jgi:long-chain acyl-CoA synthetase
VKVLEEIREHARRRPDAPALIVDLGSGRDETTSYAALVESMERHVATFRAAGAVPGDRCGLLAAQGRGFIEAALGLLAADLCMVPIPDDTGAAAQERFVAQAHLHAMVDEREGFAMRRIGAVAPVDGQGDAAFRTLTPAYLRFTSGTTNERKGVVISQPRIAERLAAANRGLEIGPDDRVMWLLPMAHHFVVSILLYLRYGAAILLPASSLARPVLELASRAGATVSYASPYHYMLLGKDTSDHMLDSLRLAVSTATGLREDVARQFHARFGKPIVQALGIIEVGLPAMNLRRALEKPTSLGQPLPDYDVWLRGDDGAPVSSERSGEVCIRGPGLFDAYLEPWLPADELTEADGFRTGDQGRLDADGDLLLVGRRSNRISMAGMKFFAEEVEAILDQHPAIAASRVRADIHARLGEIPIAELVLRPGAEAPATRDLVTHCRTALPGYKVPRRFDVVEALPMTETGKVRRWSPSGDAPKS